MCYVDFGLGLRANHVSNTSFSFRTLERISHLSRTDIIDDVKSEPEKSSVIR